MSVDTMFSTLPKEIQDKCYDTLRFLQERNEARKNEWYHIVNYHYEEYYALPGGWFIYWDN